MLLSLVLVVLQARAVAPELRAHHGLVYDASVERVALIGGSTPRGSGFTFYDDWWSFDGERWTLVRNTGRPLSGERIVWSPAGKTLFGFGGLTHDGRTLGELLRPDATER